LQMMENMQLNSLLV